jgi:hypothetical protein
MLGIPSLRGLGVANCPSIQQLEGITDPTDPCQAASTVAAVDAGTSSQNSYCPGVWVAGPSGSAVCAASSYAPTTSTTLGGLTTNELLAIGGGFILLMLFMKRER